MENIELLEKTIKFLKKSYGANCKASDLDEFRKEFINKKYKLSETLTHNGRCLSCRAKETIIFLKEVIELLKS
jgi:hypothetical protein